MSISLVSCGSICGNVGRFENRGGFVRYCTELSARDIDACDLLPSAVHVVSVNGFFVEHFWLKGSI